MGAGGQPGAGLGAAGPPLAELALRAGQDGGGVWAVVTLQHMVSSQVSAFRCRAAASPVKKSTIRSQGRESGCCTASGFEFPPSVPSGSQGIGQDCSMSYAA